MEFGKGWKKCPRRMVGFCRKGPRKASQSQALKVWRPDQARGGNYVSPKVQVGKHRVQASNMHWVPRVSRDWAKQLLHARAQVPFLS